MKKYYHSVQTIQVIRIISISSLVFALVAACNRFFNLLKGVSLFYKFPSSKITDLSLLVLYFIIIIISAILIIKPKHFFLISIESLLSSILFSIVYINSYLNILLFSISVSTSILYCNCNFKKFRYILFSVFIPCFLFEFLMPLFHGFFAFYEITIQKIILLFFVSIAIFFFSAIIKQKTIIESQSPKILNLADYKGLGRSDLYLLQDILNDMTYKEIARKINGSPGALRNKISKIYKILGVGDKEGFLSTYSEYELIYEP